MRAAVPDAIDRTRERTPFLAHYGFAVHACSPEECVLHVLTYSRIEV
jgi:hypothetical protein